MKQPFAIWSIYRHTSLYQFAIMLCVISLCSVLAKAAYQTPDAEKLLPGTPIERDITGGQVHNYRIALETGIGIKIKVEQRGVDIVLALSGPDGKEIRQENGWKEAYGTEFILWTTQASGTYQLQINTAEKETTAGHYEIKVEIFPTDERFVSAIQKFNEGLQLARENEPKLEQLLSIFEENLSLWKTLGDREMEGRTSFYASSIAYDLKLLPKAVDRSLLALEIFRSFGMKTEEYVTLSVISSSYSGMGDIQKGLYYDQQRIPLLPVVSPERAINLYLNLGINFRHLGNYPEAEEHLSEALRRARDLKVKNVELLVLSSLATLYFVKNEPIKSLEYLNSALPLSRELKQPIREGYLLLQLGQIYARASEPEQAISFFKQSLQLTNTPEGRFERAQGLMVLGGILEEAGDEAATLEAFEQALAITRSAAFRALEMRILTRIGVILSKRGEFQKALEYQQQAHAFLHANGQRSEEVSVLIDMAQTYERMGEKQKAHELLEQALILARTLVGGSGVAAILIQQARLARDDGDLKKARELMEAAIRSREESRNKFASPSLKASYGASLQNFYETYLDILMRMHKQSPQEGYDALALGASERARARSLLDLLAESQADIYQGADPALREKARSLQRQLSAKDNAYRDLINNRRTAIAAETVAKEINALTVQLQLVEAQFRASSPRYAALTQPQPLNPTEIQSLLDNNTVLLEFTLGEKQSWMWAVTPNTLASFQLPSRQEIEDASRKLYQILIARQPKAQESSIQYAARVAEADAKFHTEALALSRMLLGPIASQLGKEWKGKRLVIVASGALDYLPFATLPFPTLAEADSKRLNSYHPLIADHEIVNLPSASVLALIRRESAERQKATKMLAILADPVFEMNDPRVLMAIKKRELDGGLVSAVRSGNDSSITPAIDSELMRSVRSFGRSGFSQLPFSRIEADAISALIPKTRLLKATGFKANRETATNGELARYRIVHFATHGLLNSEHPELSGLVLSLVDEKGKAQDGFLRMQEIYNLQLPADLVVLSACQTAVGKEIKGEGLVGLTRGFMYAGAERVIASLWQVDDLATAELMKRFYRGMLLNQLRPTAALRAAQIEMMRQKRWASPYFWAGFIVQGEWR
ncbi:MAG: CHAT domain-containing protein [Acidobacteriota bacterium]